MNHLLQAFKSLDPTGDGSIEAHDLRTAMDRAGIVPAEQPLMALLGSLQGSGSSQVALAQFMELCRASGAGAEGFLERSGPALPPAAPEAAPLDETADPRVLTFIATLEEYRIKCEGEGNFEEAARCLDELAKLRKHEELRRVQSLKARHTAERAQVADAQTQQFKEFNAAWDR